MAAIASISSNGTNLATDSAQAGSSRVPQKQLGRDDFMKLLAVQFAMQDPMKPMEDTAFIAQTAQFTSLEQTTTMANELTQLRTDQQRVVANSYLGHRVTVEGSDGKPVSGDVTAINNEKSTPRLVVNGDLYPISAVLRVEPGAVTAASSASPQSGL